MNTVLQHLFFLFHMGGRRLSLKANKCECNAYDVQSLIIFFHTVHSTSYTAIITVSLSMTHALANRRKGRIDITGRSSQVVSAPASVGDQLLRPVLQRNVAVSRFVVYGFSPPIQFLCMRTISCGAE